ncbi:MAG: NAD(P)/FAD-dependent oxidoreductase [Pseudomonadales bacterium]|nr:NAD(P)/FAD-dependent oxidoreductase [Pseudomonadales bacterium]
MSEVDVIVLGAGAAGLMCALTAAERGRRVLVLEKSNKVGKKILMSGGGRCNFTNYDVTAENYICSNPHFAKAALQRYSSWDFIHLVESHNIAFEERRHGQLFCLNSAKDILTMLLDECHQVGVEIQTDSDVSRLDARAGGQGFALEVNQLGQTQTFHCDSLVVATGALSIPTLGGSDMGYEIARQFGLSLVDRRAGLVPLMFSDAMKLLCEQLSGLALEVDISCNGYAFTENLLFTHRGISGPAVLQISNYWHPGDAITVDLLPNLDATDWLLSAKSAQSKSYLKTLLGQSLAKSLVAALGKLFWLQWEDKVMADIPDSELRRIAQQLHAWVLKPSASEGYRTAEVTLGGVCTDEVSSKTMEARQQSGLYFIGEVLDVSGHLGGFNFQWAWSSGYSAGLVV